LINKVLARYFDIDGTPRRLGSTLLEAKGNVTLMDLARDAIRVVMNL